MRKSFTVSMIALIFITLGCGGGGGGAGGGQAASAANPFSTSVSTAFTAGISHIDGKYRFTQNNYLLEGAQKISALGSNSIFIYLTPSFRSDYPDESSTNWPASDPAGLTDWPRPDLTITSRWKYQRSARCDQEILVAPRRITVARAIASLLFTTGPVQALLGRGFSPAGPVRTAGTGQLATKSTTLHSDDSP